MSLSLLHDTFFGHIVRFVFGWKTIPHPDELELPIIWLSNIKSDNFNKERGDELSIRRHADHRKEKDPESDNASVHTAVETLTPPERVHFYSESTASLATTIEVAETNAEKGSDGTGVGLVDWYGPNDPEVRRIFSLRCIGWLIVPIESAKLVILQESLGAIPNLFPHILRLCRVLDIHCWSSRYRGNIPC